MSLPTISKTWTISANNRIPYTSLNNTLATYFLGVKNFLVAHGYTVKGSGNGTTGAMDATDRWITAANVNTRGAAAGNAQSWVVLTDANGADLCLTYQGATDDVGRISFSTGSLFVAAGTPQNQPTATDEVVITSANTLISTNTTQDRLWFGWVDSTSKLCRFAVARNGSWTGQLWGLELVGSSAISGAVVVWSPLIWGFSFAQNAGLVGAVTAGFTRVTASAVATTCSMVIGYEKFGASQSYFSNTKTPLQGAKGFPAVPIYIGSTTTGARGKFGKLFDTWLGRADGADGDLYGSAQFIGIAGYSGAGTGLWPWDGNSSPVLL